MKPKPIFVLYALVLLSLGIFINIYVPGGWIEIIYGAVLFLGMVIQRAKYRPSFTVSLALLGLSLFVSGLGRIYFPALEKVGNIMLALTIPAFIYYVYRRVNWTSAQNP